MDVIVKLAEVEPRKRRMFKTKNEGKQRNVPSLIAREDLKLLPAFLVALSAKTRFELSSGDAITRSIFFGAS